MNSLYVDMDGTLCVFENVDTLETLYEEGYFKNRPPMRNVIEAVEKICSSKQVDVYILSAYLSDSEFALREKKEWLNEYLPFIDPEHMIFLPCGTNKAESITRQLTKNDYLLDDYTKNLVEWENGGGTGIKILNGINHTNRTFKGNIVSGEQRDSNSLADVLLEIVTNNKALDDSLVKFSLYQIDADSNAWRDKAFLSWDKFQKYGYEIDQEDYIKTYEGFIESEDALNSLYSVFNISDLRPVDFYGRSMSISDVIVLEDDEGNERAFYVDRVGFTEVTDQWDQSILIERSAALANC